MKPGIALLVAALVAGCGSATPAPTVTATPTPAVTETPTESPAPTPRPSVTQYVPPAPTPVPTPGPSAAAVDLPALTPKDLRDQCGYYQPGVDPSYPAPSAPKTALRAMTCGPLIDEYDERPLINWFVFESEAAAQTSYAARASATGCGDSLVSHEWGIGGKTLGRVMWCTDSTWLEFTIEGKPVIGQVQVLDALDDGSAVAWFVRERPFPATKGAVSTNMAFRPQKAFTVAGGRTTGISRGFKLRGGTYEMRWTVRAGDTGSCFGQAWINTPDGSDADPIDTIFELYADSAKKRHGAAVTVVDPGTYIVGTITTCRWTVTFVHTAPVDAGG